MLVAALSLGLPPPPNHTLAELQLSDALPHAPTSSYSSSLQPVTDPSPRSREMLLAELVASLEVGQPFARKLSGSRREVKMPPGEVVSSPSKMA